MATAEGRDYPICGRLLIGLGSDTYDPLCVLVPGHTGGCVPPCSEPGCEEPAPLTNFGGMCAKHVQAVLGL